ncbi:MAG TPA: 2TM domain-containing protein [Gaiellaceae bacterium]|nr:2TM domain-containing protein [Gaiellaceae bacterium]
MVVQHHPHISRGPTQSRPELRLVEARRRRAKLHLLTYLVGNALFWVLWGAISVSADDWYWWPIVPFAGWTLVLALHLWHARRR